MVYGYSSIPLFGYSLSGGMDLDDNDYPDLVVGGVSTSSNSEITLLRYVALCVCVCVRVCVCVCVLLGLSILRSHALIKVFSN